MIAASPSLAPSARKHPLTVGSSRCARKRVLSDEDGMRITIFLLLVGERKQFVVLHLLYLTDWLLLLSERCWLCCDTKHDMILRKRPWNDVWERIHQHRHRLNHWGIERTIIFASLQLAHFENIEERISNDLSEDRMLPI